MIIQWQWVMVAFLVGIILTLLLEIQRRRQKTAIALGFYILPTLSLLLALGIGLTDFRTVTATVETAVFPAIPAPTPTIPTSPLATKPLPAPQISVHKPETAPLSSLTEEPERPQTAVHRLHIPALNLSKPVSTIPLEDGIWNVADLGSDVGWLETTAVHPNDEQAMVFVGHMTFANDNLLEQGAFADIPTLPYDTPITLETTEGTYTYFVDSVRRVSPDNTDALYQESGNAILLLTCADWNPQAGVYENRLLVRAVNDNQ